MMSDHHHSKKRKHDAEAATSDGAPKTKLSKEEKRAAKKLKKEAETTSTLAMTETLPTTIEAHTKLETHQVAEDKEARKAAKKAEKAKRKAEKKAQAEVGADAEDVEFGAKINGLSSTASAQDVRDRAQEQREARMRMIMSGITQVNGDSSRKAVKKDKGEVEGDGGVKIEATVTTNGSAKPSTDTSDESDESDGGAAIDGLGSGIAVQEKKKKSRKTKAEKKSISRAKKKLLTYETSKALADLPVQSVDDFLRINHIKISDPSTSSDSTLRPILDFNHLPDVILESRIKDVFKAYKTPTPIQAASWPYLLSGRDVVGIAETGSGKTLAFGLGCIMSVKRNQPGEKRQVQAVIVSPTRELASQIHDQLHPLAKAFKLDTVCVYGGVPKDPQREALKKAHIVVATPGRLMDFCEEKAAKLKHAKYVVLDEADRMLDQGFKDAIKTIMSKCASQRKGRQTAMFTATWPQSVRELAGTYMSNPVQINIGAANPNAELRANRNVEQRVEVLDSLSKEGRLRELVREYSPSNSNNRHLMSDNRILIFCLYKKECERVERSLRKMLSGAVKGIGCLHGDMSQALRTISLSEFKKGNIPILIATDVAARGLDIPDVKVVINYTFPLTAEDYVHRIGRTGRAGKEGLAITLFTDQEKHLAGELVNVLRAAEQEVPEELLKYDLTVKKKEHGAYGRFYREVREGEKTEGTKVVFD